MKAMKSSIRLDSAVFQLTPTRTRFDLVVSANGKTEKLATGLLKPFLAHLKIAEEQVAKGGYSIILKPESFDDARWFTKGTIERFVRFVSTPEVLERVYTIETEILQIKETIAIQSKSNMVEDSRQARRGESIEGSRPLLEPNEEKAIVLYQPDSLGSQVNGSTSLPENSRAEVLKVLETRKTTLLKEQGMAFARAVAAGFDIDVMAPLISFSKSFGASRLMDACIKFMELWEKKHETGQWIDIEAMSVQPDISPLNEAGVMLANSVNSNFDSTPDAKSPIDNKPNSQQEYMQGQFSQPVFPPWPVHSPPNAFPVFQGYSMQGMPCYPIYPGSSPYQSPYQTAEDNRGSSGQRKIPKHHRSDSEDSESENEDVEQVRSGRRKKSGKVVIRNINYITAKTQNSLDTDTGVESDAESQEQIERDHPNNRERAKEVRDADNGNWEAFQNYLLKDADNEEHAIDYEMEKQVQTKRRPNGVGDYSLVHNEAGVREYHERNISDMQNGSAARRLRGSNDEFTVRKGESLTGFQNSSDHLTMNDFEHPINGMDKNPSNNKGDDSYIVSLSRVSLNDQRNDIDIGSEVALGQSKKEKLSKQVNYEPDDLSLMPARGAEKIPIGYDPALEYELQARASMKKENGAAPRGTKKPGRDPKSRLSSDKVKVSGPIRKGKPTKLSPLDEARARAEKLRNFKADLQKVKKEKEEEEKKRIEALKMARQNRIAARGKSGAVQSTLPSQQTRKQLPTKFSPNAHRGSKFSDSGPGSTSPLQRSSIRAVSLGSSDSLKLSESKKMSTGNSTAGNRLLRSASSLSVIKKQSNIAPETKLSRSRIRRLSEPKMISSTPVSSVRSRGPVSSKKASDGPEHKKISAMMNHDKTMIASLPELKIRTPGVSGDAKASEKDTVEKSKQNRSSQSKVEQNNGDESPVLEKTVVMLEEKSNIPAVHKPFQRHNRSETPDMASEYATIHAPVSPPTAEEVDKELIEHENSNGNELVLVRLENLSETITETPKFLTCQTLAEKPYQAPYARISSLEGPCSDNSVYDRAPPASIQIHAEEPETVKACVSDSKETKLEKISEASDKSQAKEPSKGLRKFLRFGKKNHSSGTGTNGVDSVNSSEVHESAANTSNEVFTLKSLISQDETPVVPAAVHKASRHFSLRSPFKSKTAEKRMST